MISELENKDITPNMFAKKIIENPDLIYQYLDGLVSKNETYRYNCFKVLYIISENKPNLLYPHWNFFANHLRSDNNYHKMSAVLIIANLASVDTENRFEDVFDEFFENLKSKKTIVPIYIVKSSGKIVNHKPDFEGKITDLLLNIENIHLGKQIELVKSAVIESFSEFYENADKKDEILRFVKNQIDSDSPKTRKCAKEFLIKYGES
jgi:truncated hemoglobin YjbI